MRNLALSSILQKGCSTAKISATAIDPDEGWLWIASERLNADADLEIEIFRQKSAENEALVDDDLPAASFAMFTSPTSHQFPDPVSQIASLHVVAEERSLVVITRGGDLATLTLDDEGAAFDVVGSVEDGILAAAWSPDESVLVLVTGHGKMILMTPTFDVLHEAPLHSEDFGEDAPINVGWGSKQTQFHGSLGKAAAQATPSSSLASIGPSPDDDTIPRISWRGDAALFVVSALTHIPASSSDALRHRTLRIYSREGVLQSTSEPIAALEHVLAWRPSGNLIAGTQRFGSFKGAGQGKEGRHDVVFFERNGLRHGEFGLRRNAADVGDEHVARRWGYKVKELSWSSDSNVLAVWIEEDERDIVQLWTTGNYHWYLKQEIIAPAPGLEPGRFTTIRWHPEKVLELILTTKTNVIYRNYRWDTYVAMIKAPHDTGTVAVVDGSSLLLTPFRTQNVPPPMSSFQLSLPSKPFILGPKQLSLVYASFSPSSDALAALWEPGYVEIWALHTRIGPGRGPVMAPSKMWSGVVEQQQQQNDTSARQEFREVAFWTSSADGAVELIAVLGYAAGASDVLRLIAARENPEVQSTALSLDGIGWRLAVSDGPVALHRSGMVYEVNITEKSLAQVANLGNECDLVRRISLSSSSAVFIGLAASGTLTSASSQTSHIRVLARNVNSFTISDDLLIYTTTAHEAHFVSISTLATTAHDAEVTGERRRVERGSRIVTAVSSASSLVLQMPRGNLETINPRSMVMKVVRDDIDAQNYRKAFLACRKHRIDLNVLFDHDPTAFKANLPSFVDQIEDVDYINLFLTNVGSGSQSQEVISELCDGLRTELERRDLKKYVNSILTAYVVKRPSDLEAGLQLLLRLRENEPSIVEDAVKYIIFLVDAETLFNVALGMYDFQLVLMIAQHAQKDPREYLPFLRELRALETHYQRFRIDDHLRRHQSALRNLSQAGSDRFDEAMDYVEKHQLYESALSIWSETDSYKTVLSLYGDWLFDRREFKQAAIVFADADRPEKTMVAYEKALQWRELFDLASQQNMEEEDIVSTGYRVAEDLSTKQRYSEASQVLLDYAKDVREAVIALVHGNSFSEARRITSLHKHPELVEEIIHPGTIEARGQISEDLREIHEQLQKQVERLRELRVKKVEEPEAFYGAEDTALHNVDVMTDASQFTAFTRYTVAPTATSRSSSKRTSRSKRKAERKVGSGRKGTVDEEEYLLKSLTKLVARFTTAQDETSNLVPHLLQFTALHRDEARELQTELSDLQSEITHALDEVWPSAPEEVEGQEPVDSWAARMAEKEKDREKAVRDIVKPDLRASETWRTRLLDIAKKV
ncbi:IkappaB kinase complex, IKAP component [Auriscalpium vulgare]|uniref:IkappaB kinase complex, IKAP component n=1 Tax=Auriscalpium vulgare TaxID=40419 RepID=A0ACB8RXF1_9AGAM|nr:IkappaB kinase complex, IKAP component [Auriscalpium vulgare]